MKASQSQPGLDPLAYRPCSPSNGYCLRPMLRFPGTSGRKWPEVAGSGRKWPEVAGSGRKWQKYFGPSPTWESKRRSRDYGPENGDSLSVVEIGIVNLAWHGAWEQVYLGENKPPEMDSTSLVVGPQPPTECQICGPQPPALSPVPLASAVC